METGSKKQHWEHIYNSKESNTTSWFQENPETSLKFIEEAELSKTSKIIDVGGGDSRLVDHLLEKDYKDISVLDIAAPSIQKAVQRLGKKAEEVKWIISDVTSFEPTEVYDLWHDRAAFHFLTKADEIEKYIQVARKSLRERGNLIVGTFSEEGPAKCSGVEIKQYNEGSLTECFSNFFKKEKCITVDHETPDGKVQNFLFCRFSKKIEEKDIGEIVGIKKEEEIEYPVVFTEKPDKENDGLQKV